MTSKRIFNLLEEYSKKEEEKEKLSFEKVLLETTLSLMEENAKDKQAFLSKIPRSEDEFLLQCERPERKAEFQEIAKRLEFFEKFEEILEEIQSKLKEGIKIKYHQSLACLLASTPDNIVVYFAAAEDNYRYSCPDYVFTEVLSKFRTGTYLDEHVEDY